jgi:K+-sensing histidine kinase KdpD
MPGLAAAKEPVALVARDHVDEVFVEIWNGWPSIPPKALSTLFEPMVRRPRDDEKRPSGLGLGLDIACQIVQAHGGNIRVHSTDADGTRFAVRLPRRRPTPGAAGVGLKVRATR